MSVCVYVILLISGEACWWTVHPASKQRSEGEKVRVGDDVIFVSVATERYLVSTRFNFSNIKMNLKFEEIFLFDIKQTLYIVKSDSCDIPSK